MNRLTALILVFLLSVSLVAQTAPTSNPQALAFAARSMAAVTGGNSISDVTLTGNVTWNSGADSGTATLRALGTGESRMDLVLSEGTRTEIRDAQTGNALGKWVNPDSSSGYFAFQNCLTDAVWFFPALGSLAAGQNVVLSYVGQETRNAESVQHIRSYVYQSNPPPGVSTQQLSTMDFYLDAGTLLPVATVFTAYPDTGAGTNIKVEIDFSNYQSLSGVLVPLHIQKYSQGNLLADITVSGAAFNTGLPLSLFKVN